MTRRSFAWVCKRGISFAEELGVHLTRLGSGYNAEELAHRFGC
jgi:hypothetical protein